MMVFPGTKDTIFQLLTITETRRIGHLLGTFMKPGDVICLQGTLGAGKTIMAQAIADGWGTSDQVTSPTFKLVNVYSHTTKSEKLYHLDCYRLGDPDEVWTIGFDDILDNRNTVLIEWPERILPALPEDRLWIVLKVLTETSREAKFTAYGQRAASLITQLADASLD